MVEPKSEPKPESEAAEQLQLGYVAGAHGIRGAVRIKLFNPDSETLRPGLILHLREPSSSESLRTVTVAEVAPKPGSEFARVWLKEVEQRDAAEALRGREVWVDRSELPELGEDEYYLSDLIDLDVVRPGPGEGELEQLGTIIGVTSNGVQDLFEVRLGAQTWLLPAMPPFIVEIEPERVIVDVDDEMLPDRAPSPAERRLGPSSPAEG